MNINSIKSYNYLVNSRNTKLDEPLFKARQLAKYKYLGDKKRDVFIYKLEKTDIEYLENILKNISAFFKKYEITDKSAQEIFKHSLEAGILLLNDENLEKKAQILMAFSENNPSAILIGNALKVDEDGNYYYSSRKNQAKDETELDAIVTWNNDIPGEGKSILCEYFYTLLEDGFKHVYVRSEIPQNSFAVEFYKKMGFEPISEKQRLIQRPNDYNYSKNIFEYGQDLIIPMKATVSDIQKTIDKRSKELKRKPIKKMISVSLPKSEF